MHKRLIIIGASGHGRVVADIAKRLERWEKIEFLDDNDTLPQSIGVKIIGKSTEVEKHLSDSDFFIAIGKNDLRAAMQEKLEKAGADIPCLIHPGAVIGSKVDIQAGSVVMAGVVINCCSRLGKGCIINTGATLDHDNIIGDFVHISPGVNLAGTVCVGHKTWIGIGSSVTNNVNIAADCIFGAGSVIIGDINESGTYVGVPVRRV
jgi:sugar O-acyltransferase (sialic acid O-acetyltransferase NeuD family)